MFLEARDSYIMYSIAGGNGKLVINDWYNSHDIIADQVYFIAGKNQSAPVQPTPPFVNTQLMK